MLIFLRKSGPTNGKSSLGAGLLSALRHGWAIPDASVKIMRSALLLKRHDENLTFLHAPETLMNTASNSVGHSAEGWTVQCHLPRGPVPPVQAGLPVTQGPGQQGGPVLASHPDHWAGPGSLPLHRQAGPQGAGAVPGRRGRALPPGADQGGQ